MESISFETTKQVLNIGKRICLDTKRAFKIDYITSPKVETVTMIHLAGIIVKIEGPILYFEHEYQNLSYKIHIVDLYKAALEAGNNELAENVFELINRLITELLETDSDSANNLIKKLIRFDTQIALYSERKDVLQNETRYLTSILQNETTGLILPELSEREVYIFHAFLSRVQILKPMPGEIYRLGDEFLQDYFPTTEGSHIIPPNINVINAMSVITNYLENNIFNKKYMEHYTEQNEGSFDPQLLMGPVISILEQQLDPVKVDLDRYRGILDELCNALCTLSTNNKFDQASIDKLNSNLDLALERVINALAEYLGQKQFIPQIRKELVGKTYIAIRMNIHRNSRILDEYTNLLRQVGSQDFFQAMQTIEVMRSIIDHHTADFPGEAEVMLDVLFINLNRIYKNLSQPSEDLSNVPMFTIFKNKLDKQYNFKWFNEIIKIGKNVYKVTKIEINDTLELTPITLETTRPLKIRISLLDQQIASGQAIVVNTGLPLPELVDEEIVFDETLRGQELNEVYPYAENADGKTIAKTRFADELIRGSSSEAAQQIGRKETESDVSDRKIEKIEQRYLKVGKVKLDILSRVTSDGKFTTKKGTVLNLAKEAADGENDKELFFTNIEQKVQFIKYVVILINSNVNKTYDLNNEALDTINKNIKEEARPLTRSEWEFIKKCLGVISQTFYDAIDDQIGESEVVEVENAMRDIVNNIDGKPRKNTMVMLNGHTGAGKGTTLTFLGVERASETGTDGIAGRGEGFEHYVEITEGYDLARAAGELMPNKFTRLMLATDIINQRRELDAKGKQESPVYVSGFPRTEDQAKLFNGINNIKSIGLLITPETAVYRTIRRSIERTLKNQDLRDDDMSDLANVDGTSVSKVELSARIQTFIDQKNIIDPSVLTRELLQEIVSTLQLSKTARYMSYERARGSINKSLSSLGIETVNIQCDELSMSEVTNMTREVIMGDLVEA